MYVHSMCILYVYDSYMGLPFLTIPFLAEMLQTSSNRPNIDPKPTPSRPQTDPKPTPNRPQTDPKPTPNRPQIHRTSTPNQGSVGCPGRSYAPPPLGSALLGTDVVQKRWVDFLTIFCGESRRAFWGDFWGEFWVDSGWIC